MASSRKLFRLDSILCEHNAIDALEALVASGCDKTRLLSTLELIRQDWPGFDTSRTKTGLNRKRLKRAIGRFRSVADEIARINRESFGLLLLPGSALHGLRDLPDALRTYAAMLDRPIRALGPVRYPTLHVYKFYLTQHVIESTTHPHDKEIAALIGAVLPEDKRREDRKQGGKKTYDAVAHKQWRRDHYLHTADVLGERKK